MDPTLAAGIVGGTCAIAGSVVSHALLHHYERKRDNETRRRISLEYALVFLEKCKTGAVVILSDNDYYELIRNLASLSPPMRRAVIEVYQSAKTGSVTPDECITVASHLQAEVATQLSDH